MDAMETQWDVFVSYASEDREAVASPLSDLLGALGLRVWFDQTELSFPLAALSEQRRGFAPDAS